MTETLEQLVDTSWRQLGACLNEDPEIFFLDNEDPSDLRAEKTEVAKKICESCPVMAQCRLYGLLDDEAKDDHWSILGGLTHRERRAIRREIGWNLWIFITPGMTG